MIAYISGFAVSSGEESRLAVDMAVRISHTADLKTLNRCHTVVCGVISSICVFQKYTLSLPLASFDLLKYLKTLYFFPIIFSRKYSTFCKTAPVFEIFLPIRPTSPHKLTQIKADERVAVVVPLLG